MNFLFWLTFTVLFFYYCSSLLLILLLLELGGFLVIYYVSSALSMSFVSDFLVISLFSIFVMEGVIALTGLIILVSFCGSDYISSFSLINL